MKTGKVNIYIHGYIYIYTHTFVINVKKSKRMINIKFSLVVIFEEEHIEPSKILKMFC